jgi:hypothetical protein
MVQLRSGRLYVAEEDELAGPFNPDAPLITTFVRGLASYCRSDCIACSCMRYQCVPTWHSPFFHVHRALPP